jgi:hypothetical protein
MRFLDFLTSPAIFFIQIQVLAVALQKAGSFTNHQLVPRANPFRMEAHA